jgi:hypothetical protein
MQLSPTQREALTQVLIALLAEGAGRLMTQPAAVAPDPAEPTGPSSLSEIAKRRNYSRSFVYQQAKAGKLKTYRAGATGPIRATPEAEREWVRGL